MLSWFPQSPTTSDANEVKETVEEPSDDRNQQPRTPRTLPHDRILGNLFEGRDNGLNGPLHRPSILDPTNTAVYDPFTGSLLGNLVTPDQNVQPEEPGKLNEAVPKNEELWSHLSRVLELQNQISRLHLDMEEIGTNAGDPKGKGKGTRSRATSVSRFVIDDAEGEEGIGGKRDEEAERTKAREEQFSKLAGQFRGKKEAINGIMSKLDSLSRAVTEFHALQAPKIDFPLSRHNSLPATDTATEAVGSPTFGDLAPRKLTSMSVPTAMPKRADEQGAPEALVESPLSAAMTLPS
ncbi:hypothetical protein DFH07DRAFT_851476 [Mycena maculata]|uniref:Uncharacterized protein n=1 Tax=Mycena maculata TaxID=230809 RepID=A0AAD7HT84_9AGAR|nr:hypothetical protein DFH07DRAFT_851476 [Mycena maculata]